LDEVMAFNKSLQRIAAKSTTAELYRHEKKGEKKGTGSFFT